MGLRVPEPLGKRYLRVLPKVNHMRGRLDHGSPHVCIKEAGSARLHRRHTTASTG